MKTPYLNRANTPVPGAGVAKVSLQRGLSLIEMMISITIGLLILAALSTLFVNQSKTRSELDKSNRMIDNGRYAMELLSDNLSLAGFYGEFEPSTGNPPVPASLPNPCTIDPAQMAAALQLAIQGYDAATQTSLPAGAPCSLALKEGSDILVIRRASTGPELNPASSAVFEGVHYLQVSRCPTDPVNYVLSNTLSAFTLRQDVCTNGTPPSWSSAANYSLNDIVQFNNITYVSMADGNLDHTPLANIGTWWNVGGGYAPLRNFLVQIYFVSPNNAPGDSIPTLKRFELDPANQRFLVTPLVEGIEYMQIDYGLDTDANRDGAPNNYITAPAVNQWPDIVAVKMHLLARNTERSPGHNDTKTYTLGLAGSFGPFNDDFKRHAYTRFIRLTNLAGRNDPL